MNLKQENTTVGFIGLGSMGAGMAHCLLRKGFLVHVYARRPEVLSPFIEADATAHDTLAALGRSCDIVVLSLPDAPAVEGILFGDSGLAQGLRPGALVIDTSTVAATSARAIGGRLEGQGVGFLDAPVSGGQAGAQAGTLACMVGGETDQVEACRGVLSAFCQTITHVGALGAGQTVKACNQVAVAAAMLGVADALALARAQGVDPNIMRDVLLQGSARSFPMEKHAPRIIQESFEPGFRAQLMRKDLRLALDTAHASGMELAAAPVAERLLDAMCNDERGDWDWCGVALEVGKPAGKTH